MTELDNILREGVIGILYQYPGDLLYNRELVEADNEILYEQFYAHIKNTIGYYKSRANELSIDMNMISYYEDRFYTAFNRLKESLEMFGIPDYDGFSLDVGYIGLWDAEFMDDQGGNSSPFGPLLKIFKKNIGKRRVGIFQAADQQLCYVYKDNLVKAQKLANEIYEHFFDFAEKNNISNLKPDYRCPPVVQLCAGGAAIHLSGIPVPTIISMDKTKADRFSGFSALPHECGHDLSGTFRNRMLVNEIKAKIKNLKLPNGRFWEMWMEECFADAIAVAIIKEGEIFSLANLFSNYETNRIFKDRHTRTVDEHPNRHIRVLLTIEIGRILGINKSLLDKTEKEWISYGKNKNKSYPPDKIFNEFKNELYSLKDFVTGVGPVAAALVDTSYDHINGKTIKDIFSNFKSKIAEEMRASINSTEKKWLK